MLNRNLTEFTSTPIFTTNLFSIIYAIVTSAPTNNHRLQKCKENFGIEI